MTAAALVAILHARGVILKPHGGRLRVMPASAVTPDEIQALRQLKLEVFRLLTGAEPGAQVLRPSAWSLWPEALSGVGTRRTVPFTPCALCPRRTFVSYGATPLCLDCAIAPTTPTDVTYREALRRVWTLAAEGERAHHAACLAALEELARRLDDVGEPTATEHHRRWEEEWCRETGRCPRCGETGPRHDG